MTVMGGAVREGEVQRRRPRGWADPGADARAAATSRRRGRWRAWPSRSRSCGSAPSLRLAASTSPRPGAGSVSERPRRRYGWEDYLYPPNEAGIQVLRNKLGLRTYAEAFNAERQLTALRAAELVARPNLIARTFDAGHWKAIHRQIFQDVYEWAGEFRTVDIGKGGHGFAAESQLEEYAGVILGQVRAVNMFAGRDRGGVVEG